MRFWQRHCCPSETAHIPFLLAEHRDGCVPSVAASQASTAVQGWWALLIASAACRTSLPTVPLPRSHSQGWMCPCFSGHVEAFAWMWTPLLVWLGWKHSLGIKQVCFPYTIATWQCWGSCNAFSQWLSASPWLQPVADCWQPQLLFLLPLKPFQAAPLCLRSY